MVEEYTPLQEQLEYAGHDVHELDLKDFILSHPNLESFRGTPQGILSLIDEFKRTRNCPMQPSNHKARIIGDLVAHRRPTVMIEMGGYVGYSAILFGEVFFKQGIDNGRIFSLEPNHRYGEVAKFLIDLAGLSNFVEVMTGPTDASIRNLLSLGLEKVDFMLVGYDNLACTPSLKLFEELKMVSPGTVIVVDNSTFSGNKPYMEYVRSSVEEKREIVKRLESTDIFNMSTILATIDPEVRAGNPNLKYVTWPMDGTGPAWSMGLVEVVECTGEEENSSPMSTSA